MHEHLAIARKKVLYPQTGQGRPDPEVWPTWLHWPTAGEFFVALPLLYSCLCIAGAFWWVKPNLRSTSLLIAALSVTLIACAGSTYSRHRDEVNRDMPLVVVTSNTSFHRGNGTSYPQHAAVPILPRGLEARIIHRRGDWLQLRLSTGEIGWLPRNQVLIVEP